MTTGDKLWADNDGRVELQLDSSLIRLNAWLMRPYVHPLNVADCKGIPD
jgi:hypothetical protein